MPNKKISELTTVASPLSADYIPVVEAGVTKKATLASLPLSDAEVTALALKAPLASPALTGTPTVPTAAVDTNTTQAASTAFVVGQAYAKLASPALTGTPTAPTAASGTSTTQIATTEFVRKNGVAFAAYASALQSIPTNTNEKITLNQEEFDSAGAFDAATNSRFQPTTAGYYMLTGHVQYSSAVANIMTCFLHKNGVEHRRGTQISTGGSAGSAVTGLVYLNGTTDYIELFTYQNSGGAIDTDPGASLVCLSGFLVRQE
jgi:hypothetical protein